MSKPTKDQMRREVLKSEWITGPFQELSDGVRLRLPDDDEEEQEMLDNEPLSDLQIAEAYRGEAIRLRAEAKESERRIDALERRVDELRQRQRQSASEREAALGLELSKVRDKYHSVAARVGGMVAASKKASVRFEEMQTVYGALVTAGRAPELKCEHGNPANRCLHCLTLVVRRANRNAGE